MRATAKSTTRKATAITLAAALVVAVYLNWQYSRTGVSLNEDAVNVSAAVVETEAEAVAASPITDRLMTEAEAVSSANKNYGEAQLVSVANDSGTRFFEQARLKREKAHDEAMDTLQKSLKSSSLTAEEKKEYTAQMAAGLEDLNAENEIEKLVRRVETSVCQQPEEEVTTEQIGRMVMDGLKELGVTIATDTVIGRTITVDELMEELRGQGVTNLKELQLRLDSQKKPQE